MKVVRRSGEMKSKSGCRENVVRRSRLIEGGENEWRNDE